MSRAILRLVLTLAVVFTLGSAGLPGGKPVAEASPVWNCFPTCATNDGKMLAMAGTRLNTLAGSKIYLSIRTSADMSSVTVGFFDGDSGATGNAWDYGVFPVTFALWPDPEGNLSYYDAHHTIEPPVAQWLSSSLPDNSWSDSLIANVPAARTASGAYSYVLIVEATDPGKSAYNTFKVHTDGAVGVLKGYPFAFLAPFILSSAEVSIIYPSWTSLEPTTYNGTWNFYFQVPTSVPSVTVWDGDLDLGPDTDDPDTSGSLPWWATSVVQPESARPGVPLDDKTSDYRYVRTPNVTYDLYLPDGRMFANPNPSGNLEWEQFKVSSENGSADVYVTSPLPAGLYRVTARGVDLSNLNAFLFDYPLLGVNESGDPAPPPGTGTIGDRVWHDVNGNGLQDDGEPGLAGVSVTYYLDFDGILNENGEVTYEYSMSTITDANGYYSFSLLPSGNYIVSVDANTLPGGAVQTYDLVGPLDNSAWVTLAAGANISTVDFGYRANGAIGDRVWRDLNGDGAQAGEPGLAGVTVNLLKSGGTIIGTATTDANGIYRFNNLFAGSYTVSVEPTTLPAGVVPTFDLDGIGTPNNTVIALAAGQAKDDVDFGYRDSGGIGDRVWRDLNGNGAQDAGEPGIAAVMVSLLNAGGTVIGTTTTDANGNYKFNNLPAGSYTVSLDPATLPVGAVPTFDLDGIGTPNTTAVALAAGQTRDDVDFGYKDVGSIGDRVWHDVNGSGTQDGGEPGIAGVTVKLLNASGTVIGTATTDANGSYKFNNVLAGSYTVSVDPATLPGGTVSTYDLDGIGTPNNTAVALAAGQNRGDVDFGYRLPAVANGNTATIGFWHNNNGQRLILSLNGGSTSTSLATWLATNFPYLYGTSSANNLTGKNNGDVAALFMTFFNVKGKNTDAQILGAALAVYVTDSDLAGNTASKYGFSVSPSGTGLRTYNVGANGTKIGLSNNTSYTVWTLLNQANLRKQLGNFDANAFNSVFDGINQLGDIR